MSDIFDDGYDNLGKEVDSYFTVKSNEEDQLDWLKTAYEALLNESQYRTYRQREFLYAYMGQYFDRSMTRDLATSRGSGGGGGGNSSRRRIRKFVINEIHDITETKVSQLTRLKPDVEVLPVHDEWGDKSAAKVTSMIVKNVFEANGIDDKVTEMERLARIMGEAYLFVEWDPARGDKHPSYVEAQNLGLKKIVLEDGEEVSTDQPIMTGDVKYEVEVPWRVLLQRKEVIEDVDYCFRIKVMPVDELAEIYNVDKDLLMQEAGVETFAMDRMENDYLENHVPVITFFHRGTDFLPKGKKIVFTPSVILEAGDNPSSDGKLPFVRHTDLDIPKVLNGISKYEFVLPVQRMYDNINTLITKNIYLTAHAKWLTPRGAVKLEQLGNDNTIVQYSGGIPPQLAQIQPNTPEVYTYREQLKGHIQTLLGNHGISRGEVPKGITAASALTFLNELESNRASTEIGKHAALVKNIAKMTIVRAADNYDINDGRLMRIVGKNNEHLIRHFDTAVLHKPYDVKFDSSTGLPETKAAKIQRLLEAMQRNPNLFSPERWEELLDLGSTEKMVSLATSATQAADSENEDFTAGKPVMMPEEFEDHIAHWRAHVQLFQNRSFKEEADNEAIKAAKDHLYATETIMLAKYKNNPTFEAEVANLKLFPIFFHDGYIAPRSLAQQQAEAEGAANRGAESPGPVAGTPTEGDI